MFLPGKPFQPSLVFAGKARAYPGEAPAPFRCPLYARLLDLLANTRLDRKGLPGTNTSLLRKSVNYGRNKFCSTGHWCQRYQNAAVIYHSNFNPSFSKVELPRQINAVLFSNTGVKYFHPKVISAVILFQH